MNTESIQDYIIETEQNLRIAAAVSEAWPEARQKLVQRFLSRLENRLKSELNDWEFDQDGTIYSDDYATFDFWKPAWRDQYGLSLQWGSYGKEMVFGVYREKEKIGNRQFSSELLQAIKKQYSWATTNPWFEARIRMKNPASDWSSPEILWQMHNDTDNFLEQVVEQLLELAKASKLIIDRLAEKK